MACDHQDGNSIARIERQSPDLVVMTDQLEACNLTSDRNSPNETQRCTGEEKDATIVTAHRGSTSSGCECCCTERGNEEYGRPRQNSIDDIYDILRGMQAQLTEVHERWRLDIVQLQKAEKENNELLEKIESQGNYILGLHETLSCGAAREKLLIQQCDQLKDKLSCLQKARRTFSFHRRVRNNRSKSDTIITNSFASFSRASGSFGVERGCQVDAPSRDIDSCKCYTTNEAVLGTSQTREDLGPEAVTECMPRTGSTTDGRRPKMRFVRKSKCFSWLSCVVPCKKPR